MDNTRQTCKLACDWTCELTFASLKVHNLGVHIRGRTYHSLTKSLQSCPTLCDHRRQPTRLPHPWDSPGKNTGVGCHFLLQCMKVKSESEVAQLYPTLSDPMDCSLPGPFIHVIFQARVLEWGDIAFSGTYIYVYIKYVCVCVCVCVSKSLWPHGL